MAVLLDVLDRVAFVMRTVVEVATGFARTRSSRLHRLGERPTSAHRSAMDGVRVLTGISSQ